MSAKPTHSALLYVATASVAMTNEATTALTAGLKYRITNFDRRRVDPAVTVSIQVSVDNGVYQAAPAGTKFDYLQGVVTFPSSQGTNPALTQVVVTGAYMTVVPLGRIKDVSLSVTADIIEETALQDGAYKKRRATLMDFSADLSGFTPAAEDIDPGAGVLRLADQLAGGRLYLDVQPSGLPAFRAWVKVENIEQALPEGDLVQSNFRVVGSAILANDGVTYAAWGYSE